MEDFRLHLFARQLILVLAWLATSLSATVLPTRALAWTWDGVPAFEMKGGLRAYWNVMGRAGHQNDAEAYSRGFLPITLVNTFADYPNQQRENINNFLGKNNSNPWVKPPFFERVIRRNLALKGSPDILVNDIEFDFEEDPRVAFANPQARIASGIGDYRDFKTAYFREWASWYALPSKWTKDLYPESLIGLYGPQPFRRDYWGISTLDTNYVDGAHAVDTYLWKFIDPFVDFYVSSIYNFYDTPASVFYMATNVEENYRLARGYGDKPVFAYTWLRYHPSNRGLRNREIEPYLAEAMAIVPYFSGAKGIVLWGYEQRLGLGGGQPYKNLPLFVQNLARIAVLSEQIGKGRLEMERPARLLWFDRAPLVRTITVNSNECVIMAINPWQNDTEASQADVTCGDRVIAIPMNGRHTTLAEVRGSRLTLH